MAKNKPQPFDDLVAARLRRNIDADHIEAGPPEAHAGTPRAAAKIKRLRSFVH